MYYLTVNGATVGPMTANQLLAYNVDQNTPISKDGGQWMPLYTYPELMELYNRNAQTAANAVDPDSKRVLCGIMAIIFGGLGVQYFVMGKIGGGFLTILLTLITCGLWEVVTLIQGIMMLCMSDAEFRRKYIESTSTLPLF